MEALQAIFGRRSVRRFQAREIEPRKIETMLQAAMAAPSAMNEQPWEFVLIDRKDSFERIMQVHPYAGMLATAPLAILVCGNRQREKVPGNYWVLDCSCATQNLLLAAHALGLGAVWTGIFPEKDRMRALSEICDLPAEVLPLALVVVGYPDGPRPLPADRFQRERIHLNRW